MITIFGFVVLKQEEFDAMNANITRLQRESYEGHQIIKRLIADTDQAEVAPVRTKRPYVKSGKYAKKAKVRNKTK